MKKKSNVALTIILSILAGIVIAVVLLVLLINFAYSDDDSETDETVSEETQLIEEDDDEYYDEYDDETEYINEDQVSYEAADGNFESWTVMFYLCGSDLETESSHATDSLVEVLETDSSDKVNFLVETGGAKEWHLKEYSEYYGDATDIDPKSLGYYKIDGESITLEKTQPLASMGDPETLSDFITWSAKEYPADRYMLILWDHGGGSTGGVCYDELFDDDCLTLPEIKSAVTGADVPLEVVGFDACLMASLETAEMLHGYGHYMVASQENVPGTSWDYSGLLSYLKSDPSMDGLELGKRIADCYQEKCRDWGSDDMITLSVTDLTKIPALSSAYKNLSGELVLCTSNTTDLRTVSQGASKAESYGSNSQSQGYSNLIDLGDLVSNTDSVLNENAESVKKALSDAVKYNVHGSMRSGSNGLSVFYPNDTDEYEIESYKACSDNTAFLEYISILEGNWDSKEWEQAWQEAYAKKTPSEGKYDSYFNGEHSIASDYDEEIPEDYYETISNLSPVKKDDYNLKFTQKQGNDKRYRLKITSGLDYVSAVDFMLFYEEPDSGNYVYLGSDNSLSCDFDKGEFTEQFDGYWMTIGGEYVYAELTEENEKYNLYTIPILLNGEEKYLKAVYDYSKEDYSILGAYDGTDEESGHSGRDVSKLKNGDKIKFLFYVFDPESDKEDDDLIPLTEITWKNGMKMEDSRFENASFLYMFSIESIFGDTDTGDPIYMQIKNGKITSVAP
ncbi:MAG: hypothetical protein J5910_09090 [Lachnospiraceae bacterium]|nr:hypothetical protein [Lachnospiraceae bacterium]